MQCTSSESMDECISQRLNREDMYYTVYTVIFSNSIFCLCGHNSAVPFLFFFLLVCEYEGARYSDVNEVMHMEQRRSISGSLKWWMLLYEMHKYR